MCKFSQIPKNPVFGHFRKVPLFGQKSANPFLVKIGFFSSFLRTLDLWAAGVYAREWRIRNPVFRGFYRKNLGTGINTGDFGQGGLTNKWVMWSAFSARFCARFFARFLHVFCTFFARFFARFSHVLFSHYFYNFFYKFFFIYIIFFIFINFFL